MEVKLAKSAGFCWGVKRAIDMALELRSRDSETPIHTLGPLIHNPQTLKMLQKKRVFEVAKVDEAESAVHLEQEQSGSQGEGQEDQKDDDNGSEKPDGYLLVRAHGIPPETRQQIKDSNLKMVDATCPDVGLIAGNIRRNLRKGCDIVVLGDPKHAEVIGLMGYTEGRGHVVQSVEDVAKLPELNKPFVVAQSTMEGETWLNVSNAVKARFSDTMVKNTICDATTDRQSEVLQLSEEVDVMVVVGGRNSANTKKLVKLAASTGIPAYQVETDEEVDDQWFGAHCHTVGVTAGASTPNWLIMKVVERIESVEEVQERSTKRFFALASEFLLENHILLAVGASALTYVAAIMMGLVTGTARFWAMAASGLFVHSMHSFHSRRELGTFKFAEIFQIKSYPKSRWAIFAKSGSAFFLGLGITAHLGIEFFAFYLLMSFLGFSYRVSWIPVDKFKWLKYRSLLEVPGSRDIFMAIAWATMVVGMPALCLRRAHDKTFYEALQSISLPVVAAFAFVAIMVFVRSLVSDERDIKRDKLIGRETLPIVLGAKKTIQLHWLVLLSLSAIFIFLGLRPGGSPLALVLLPALLVTYFYVHLYHYRIKYRSIMLDLLADGKFLAIGGWTYAWWHWIH